MGWVFFGVVWLGFAVVTAIAASARGRDPMLWFLLGAIFGVFGLLAVLVMESERAVPLRKNHAALARENQDRRWSNPAPAPPRRAGARKVIAVHKGMQVIEEGDRFVVGLSVFGTHDEAIAFIDRTQGD